jgi:Zn-dependent M28 family amino/carboxypeptidase
MRDATRNNVLLVDNLVRHVDCLAGLIGPRHLGKPASLAAAAAYVERELAGAGYAPTRQTYSLGGQEVANIVAELAGGRRKEELVVLGAHYDTVWTTPGADDNASAVAVMLEAARLLRKLQPARTVRFVGFACEEKPYFHTGEMGSQVYARQCHVRGDKIVGMLCLEMVGYYSTEARGQRVPETIPRLLHWAFPKRGDFLAAVGNLRSLGLLWQFRRGFKRAVRFPLFSIALPEAVSEIRLSDNSSFWDQGYPALMLTDTSFLRNPHYHLPTDTPATLDYERMAKVTLGVVGGVGTVAGQ